jgi:hypothetical protein
MREIVIQFNSDGASLKLENVNGLEILKAITIITHEAKAHGAPDGAILAAVFAGVNDDAFKRIYDGSQQIGDNVSMSSKLAELLKGFDK